MVGFLLSAGAYLYEKGMENTYQTIIISEREGEEKKDENL